MVANPLYRPLRAMPFREAFVPWKMFRGWLRNRNAEFPAFSEATALGGRVRKVRGVPVVELNGSPFELGLQHGTLLKPQIHCLYERYLRIFAGRWDHEVEAAMGMSRHMPEDVRAEIEGFAQGAEIPLGDAMLGACFLDIHKVALCSTFVVHDNSSESGEILFGRNLDFPTLSTLNGASCVFIIRQTGKRPVCSVAYPGLMGCITGMNDAGLTMAMMLIYGHTRADHLAGVPFPFVYRQLLQDYDTVDEAANWVVGAPFSVCNNMMLADAGRRARVLELHPRGSGALDAPDPDFPVYFCTNHFRTGPRKWGLAATAPSSYARLGKMAAIRRQRRVMNSEKIRQLLADVAIPLINLQRVMLYPERRSIELGVGRSDRGPRDFVALGADELWGSGDVSGNGADKQKAGAPLLGRTGF